MSGDESVRRCAKCDHAVYNLSSMSNDEVRFLVEKSANEQVCAVLCRDRVGSVLTRDNLENVPGESDM